MLQADGGAGATTAKWYFGDGATALGASTMHNFSVAGTYPVVVVTTSLHGSMSATFDLLRVSPAPVVPAINCTPTAPRTYLLLSCSTTNSSLGSDGIATAGIGWDFGDGTSVGGPASLDGLAQHTYTVSGSRTVNVSIQSSDGRLAWAILHLTVCSLAVSVYLLSVAGVADIRHPSGANPSGCLGRLRHARRRRLLRQRQLELGRRLAHGLGLHRLREQVWGLGREYLRHSGNLHPERDAEERPERLDQDSVAASDRRRLPGERHASLLGRHGLRREPLDELHREGVRRVLRRPRRGTYGPEVELHVGLGRRDRRTPLDRSRRTSRRFRTGITRQGSRPFP